MKMFACTGLSALFLFLSSYSLACSCMERTLEENFEAAEAVFFGRIIDATLLEGDDSLVNTGNRMVEAHYEVRELFKGDVSSGGRIFFRESNGVNCTASLVVSGYYLVFIGKNQLVSDCSGTSSINDPAQLEQVRALSLQGQ